MKNLKNNSRCLTWAMALLLTATAVGCGGGGGRDPILGGGVGTVILVPPADAVLPGLASCPNAGPRVTVTDPTNDNQFATTSTTGVANGGKRVAATFDDDMNAATINASTFRLAPTGGVVLVPASVNYDASTKIATLTTSSALLVDTSYTAVIEAPVANGVGTGIGCTYTWTFKTAAVAAEAPSTIGLGLLEPIAIASAGGLTNSGATKINGDTVLAPLATCNAVAVGNNNDFGGIAGCGNPANVPLNNVGDLVITQTHPDTTTADSIMAALVAKWNSLSPALTPNATVLGCGTIGSLGQAGALLGCSGNSTLPPGTYISSSNSTIDVNGILTLDAAGDANAVWIFQAPSALTTGVNSQILLTGGAKASNVFWYVGSSATLGGGTSFNGNVLASASVAMGTLATSCGRLLAGAEGAGTFTFLSNTVSVPGHPQSLPGCE